MYGRMSQPSNLSIVLLAGIGYILGCEP